MSLNQKYTWNDFLKENPEFKKNDIKRTSAEGKKAFEAAYKTKVKDVLKNRLEWIKNEETRTGSLKNDLAAKMKETKKGRNKKKIQLKVGAKDKYINRLKKMAERTKEVQKSI